LLAGGWADQFWGIASGRIYLHETPVDGNLLRTTRVISPERILLSNFSVDLMVSSRMPPVPPANRSKKGRGSDPEMSKDTSVKQPEHHHNAAEEGETANIKQNTTNKGFFRGRRFG
jgi:hypothetical protein